MLADPPQAIVLQAAAEARRNNIDLVIGLGGGSSIEVAKLIAILPGGEQELRTIHGIGNAKGARLPLVQIPTTAGTGSEVTLHLYCDRRRHCRDGCGRVPAVSRPRDSRCGNHRY